MLEQHFSELDVLWERREHAVFDTEFALEDLAELEIRAGRHLAGILLGQGHALDLARAAVQGEETGAATAGGFVLLGLGPVELRDELLEWLATAGKRATHGIRIAWRHRALDGAAESRLRAMAESAEPLVRACAADVLAFQRRSPVQSVRDLLDHDEADLRALVCASLGRWRCRWELEDLLQALIPPSSPALRRAALETSARVGLPALIDVCRELGFRQPEPIAEAAAFLGVVAGHDDLERMIGGLRRPDLADAALSALGALGCPAAIPPILEALREPRTAHAAAAAFMRITGAENVRGTEPLLPPPDLPGDEAAFWDEHLATDPIRATRWWEENGARFDKEHRWQRGIRVSGASLRETFTPLPLATRRDLYLRACATDRSTAPDLELEASAIAQLGAS